MKNIQKLLDYAQNSGYLSNDPDEVLYYFLNKKGYSNLALSKLIGVSEGTIRYWIKNSDMVYQEFLSKVSLIGYTCPKDFMDLSQEKGITVAEQALLLGVTTDKLKSYFDSYERHNS